jgi:hypothetical protein
LHAVSVFLLVSFPLSNKEEAIDVGWSIVGEGNWNHYGLTRGADVVIPVSFTHDRPAHINGFFLVARRSVGAAVLTGVTATLPRPCFLAARPHTVSGGRLHLQAPPRAGSAGEAKDRAVEGAESTGEVVKETAKDVASKVAETAEDVIGERREKAKDAWNEIKGVAQHVWDEAAARVKGL